MMNRKDLGISELTDTYMWLSLMSQTSLLTTYEKMELSASIRYIFTIYATA